MPLQPQKGQVPGQGCIRFDTSDAKMAFPALAETTRLPLPKLHPCEGEWRDDKEQRQGQYNMYGPVEATQLSRLNLYPAKEIACYCKADKQGQYDKYGLA